MPGIIEDLLRPVPLLGPLTLSESDEEMKGEAKEDQPPVLTKLRLAELQAIQAAYSKLASFIVSVYGLLNFMGKQQNADNLLPFLIEFLPEEKAVLRTMRNKARLLFDFYSAKSNQSEKAYNSMALVSAIQSKYDTAGNFQKILEDLGLRLQVKGLDEAKAKKLRKEKGELESFDQRARQLHTILQGQAQQIENDLALALEPQRSLRKELEDKLFLLVKPEKEQLLAQMRTEQEIVLKQAGYKMKNSFFFNQKRLDQSNASSALFAETVSFFALFENRHLSFAELLNQIGLLYQKTAKSKEVVLNPAAVAILLKTYRNLVSLKEEAEQMENALAELNESLEELEKLLRMNKIKRALRELEGPSSKPDEAEGERAASGFRI